MPLGQFLIELARTLMGNAWNRTGSVLAVIGASSLTGWVDQVVAKFFSVNIQPAATAVGFSIMLLGVWMLWYAKAWPNTDARATAHPRDQKQAGPLAGLTNSQLRERTLTLTASMRVVEMDNRSRSWTTRTNLPRNSTEQERHEAWQTDTSESVRLHVELATAYRTKMHPEALLLLEELARRGPYPPPDHFRPPSPTNPHALPTALRTGELSGPSPMSTAADYLEQMARYLP